MCYSALVRKDMEKTARDFGARFDIDSFVQIYALREKLPGIKIAAGMDAFFLEHNDPQAKKIRSYISEFQKHESERRDHEMSVLQQEIADLKTRLELKATKTHQKSLEAKIRKLEKLEAQSQFAHTPFNRAQNSHEKEAYRIYPYYFAPVIQGDGKSRVLRPMRYRILPHTGVEIPNSYNVFNARRDSLFQARTWRSIFGKHHAIFPFEKFFEWVENKEDKEGKKQELSFKPDGFDTMWAASLFDESKGAHGLIRSFAMVTDEPPPEVAEAGHDRCPVFLSSEYIDQWLNPAGVELPDLAKLLDNKQKTYYSHQLAA